MKVTIDTENKTVTLKESVNLGEFINTIDDLLPRKESFSEYTLIAETYYTNPVTYPIYPSPSVPTTDPWPWWTPITCSTGENTKQETK